MAHELSHVIQYESLGFDGFLQRYATDALAQPKEWTWASPLEVIAYAVQGRYLAGDEFSVDHMTVTTLRGLGLLPGSAAMLGT